MIIQWLVGWWIPFLEYVVVPTKRDSVPRKTDTNNIYKIYPSYDEKRTDKNESIRRELHKTKNSKGYD
jgi:hypothetical protein